jgi:uncharacterized membrane protein YedE/YeeE
MAPARVARETYADPYVAGVGIGIVLLAAFLLAGRGLGASGAFDAVTVAATQSVAPAHAAANPYLAAPRPPLTEDWLLLELLGVIVGAMLSARLAGRMRWTTERGPNAATWQRIAQAVAGGLLMGVGARLARGCTSGLGLTGGATLSVGAWLFIGAAFAAGFAAFALVRRQWT